jgi:uncharacterized RDD family membrane protein YckC
LRSSGRTVPVPASEKLTIETPEQIALEFPLASAGSRFLALAIDTLLQLGGFAVLGVIALVASILRVDVASVLGTWVLAIVVILGFVLYYGYFAMFEALWSGQTPGKRAIRLRVITTSGRPITVYQALIRNLLRVVDQMPGIYGVALISLFLTERHQRLGDLAADTVVVTEQPIAPRDLPATPRTSVARRGAARLTPEELGLIETFLDRRNDLADGIRVKTAAAIAERVRRQLHLPVSDGTADEALLEEVAAEARAGWR